jgi:hypothetical membrane protein
MSDHVRPFVPRSVRVGGALIGVGALQFVAAMIVVQLRWPGYSDLTNYISDLGNTATSPLPWLFNASIVLFGVLAFVGILAAWGGFPPGGLRLGGLGLLLLAAFAAILVGFFPENVNPSVHDLASLVVFGGGGAGVIVLSGAMRPGTSWAHLRAFSVAMGVITLAALLYYAPTQIANTTFDPGLVERIIVAPIILWAIVAAIHLGRLPVRPRIRLGSPA